MIHCWARRKDKRIIPADFHEYRIEIVTFVRYEDRMMDITVQNLEIS